MSEVVTQTPVIGTRIRKPKNYVRYYQHDYENVLENGDMILIEPSRKVYVINPQYPPEPIPEVTVNIVDKWTSSLAAHTAANPSSAEKLIRELDVNDRELVLYSAYIAEPGFTVQFAQPQTDFKFSNKAGTKRFSWGNNTLRFVAGEHAFIPIFWVLSNNTPVYAKVYSTNMNKIQYFCRIKFNGFKFKLLPAPDGVNPDDPRIVLTVNTGVQQAA